MLLGRPGPLWGCRGPLGRHSVMVGRPRMLEIDYPGWVTHYALTLTAVLAPCLATDFMKGKSLWGHPPFRIDRRASLFFTDDSIP